MPLKNLIFDLGVRFFGYGIYRLWVATLRMETKGEAGELPAIVAFFHQDIFTAIGWMARHHPHCHHSHYYALVSPSRDGDYLSRILRSLGFGLIRGSSETGPIQGMWKSLKILRAGKGLMITPDGPKGPPGKVKDGIVNLAAFCGVPIYILTITYHRYHRLKSWDCFILPFPFSRCIVSISEPLWVRSGEDRETVRRKIEKYFHD